MSTHQQNILFVCTANRDRSKTAEIVINEKYPQFQCFSAGTNKQMCQDNGGQYITQQLINDCDAIVFMQPFHYIMVAGRFIFPEDQAHHVWNIQRHYHFMDEELIARIIENFKSTFHLIT